MERPLTVTMTHLQLTQLGKARCVGLVQHTQAAKVRGVERFLHPDGGHLGAVSLC